MSLEVILGGMYSGKSEELIKRVRRYQYAQKRVIILKPAIDTRDGDYCSCRNGEKIKAIPINCSIPCLTKFDEYDVICLDEAQFFYPVRLLEFIKYFQTNHIIEVSALDMDWEGKPYQHIGLLCCMADTIYKPHAICHKCGNEAKYSWLKPEFRKEVKDGVLIGSDAFEARCEKCFID